MKCPSCNKALSFLKVKKTFQCSYCHNSLEVTNYLAALFISFGIWAIISVLAWFSGIFHESVGLSFFLDVCAGAFACIFVFSRVVKIELKNNVEKVKQNQVA